MSVVAINPVSPPAPPTDLGTITTLAGLTGDEAARRLEKDGQNAMPDSPVHP